MKIGTLVMLKYEASHNHFTHNRGDVYAQDLHGLGVVIEAAPLPKYVRGVQGDKRVLVSFPKLGVEQWRTSRFLKVIA